LAKGTTGTAEKAAAKLPAAKNGPGMVRDLGVSQAMGDPQVTIVFNTKMV